MNEVIIYKDNLLLQGAAGNLFRQIGAGVDLVLRGTSMYGVRHDEDATKVLHNLGHTSVPAPVSVPGRFSWPGRYTPMQHQRKVTDFYTINRRCFNLSGMGTGKTASSVWAAEYMMQADLIKRVLVVAPLSCLHRVWVDEIGNLTPMRGVSVAHGDKKKRKKALDAKTSWTVINHDGVKFELDALLAEDFDLVIVDEFTAFKTHNSQRSKALKKLVAKPRLWMLSGTPMPKSPEDAYFPCKLVNPELGMTLTRFRDATMLKNGPFRFIPRHDAKDTVRSLMQPAVLVRKEDVLDLPPVVHIRREIPLTSDQKKMIKRLKNERLVNIDASDGTKGVSTAINAAVLAGRVLQIAQGALKLDDGTIITLNVKDRLAEVANLIREAEGKAIVYAPYTASLNMLEGFLSSHFSVVRVDGGTSAANRNQAFSLFQDATEPQVLVAHERVASHGLTLTAASLTCWYGPTTSNESYLQANQRMNRPGQTRSMTIAQIGGCPQEWRVYDTLASQGNMQQTLLDLYETY